VEETSDFGPAPEQLTLEDHLFLEETRAAKARVSRLWGAGSVLVLLILGAQAVYFYRGEIAAHYPSLRPNLTQLCASMGCVINLPQRPQLIAIEASDLQAIDTARPGIIQLTATLRNHAGHDLGFPVLDLVLTNTNATAANKPTNRPSGINFFQTFIGRTETLACRGCSLQFKNHISCRWTFSRVMLRQTS
jgi:hypothetical protein